MRVCVRGMVLVLGATIACAGTPDDQSGAAETGSARPAAAQSGEERPWDGRYSLRGTLEGGRQATGRLEVQPLRSGEPMYEETRARVLRLYPGYEEPFFTARLRLETEGEPVEGRLTCAHGPGEARPLVCEPVTTIAGLERATLVVNRDGRAVLTGSHGEGVSIEFGRFTWERAGDA